MVFQEPMSALNPVFTVGKQIADALRTNLGMSKKEAKARVIELLQLVGIPPSPPPAMTTMCMNSVAACANASCWPWP